MFQEVDSKRNYILWPDDHLLEEEQGHLLILKDPVHVGISFSVT